MDRFLLAFDSKFLEDIWMGILAAVGDATIPGSFHEWSETVTLASVLWGVIVLLGGGFLWYALADRNNISTTLKELVHEFQLLREDLAKNYATKSDFLRVEEKIDRHIEHGIVRREMERRTVIDAERE